MLIGIECWEIKDGRWEESGVVEKIGSEKGKLYENREDKERGWKVWIFNGGCFIGYWYYFWWDC